jgi:hypothetical protein
MCGTPQHGWCVARIQQHFQRGGYQRRQAIFGFKVLSRRYMMSNSFRGDVAYMIADISEVREDQIKDIYKKLSGTPFNIVTRMLY